MSDDLELAVRHFCEELKRERYRVDRERAGDVHIILVRDWGGDVVGWYAASAVLGHICIEELEHTAP